MTFFRVSTLLGALVLPLLMASCDSSRPKGLPKNLPVINLHDSPRTPTHSMEKKDYPFDPSSGDYVIAWASQGESAASSADAARWQSSHGGSVSRRQPSPVTKVSSRKSSSKTYTIKSGDTLGGIARKFNTTVSKLKSANGLKSDLIRAGKTLKIP